MKVDLSQRLNAALSGIDTAKSELAIACATGNDGSVEAAGDEYLKARDEMGATMAAIAEAAPPAEPPAPGAGS